MLRRKKPSPPELPRQNITTWDDPRDFEEFTVIEHPLRGNTSSVDLPTHPSDEFLHDDFAPNSAPLARSPPPTLINLPAELIPEIVANLPYPDILALRHTHPRFLHTGLLSTSKPAKIAWLLSRSDDSLPIPVKSALRLDSDAAFNRHPEVRRFMIARRQHAECGTGAGGCVVVAGQTCGGRKVAQRRTLLGITATRYAGERRAVMVTRWLTAACMVLLTLATDVWGDLRALNPTHTDGGVSKWIVGCGALSLGMMSISVWLGVGFALGGAIVYQVGRR